MASASMANVIDSMKRERSAAKRAVTVAANRLHHGVELSMNSIHEMAKDLDQKYCDFLDAAVEFREICVEENVDISYLTVSNMNLDEYEQDVKTTYCEASSYYKNHVESNGIQTGFNPRQSPSFFLKKRDLPKFSGERKDWPEFKSIWKKLVVPTLPNTTALASELKLACREGSAYAEIANISAGADDAYKQMWSALCLHYDNVTLAVSSAIDEIRDFRAIQEDDYEGVVDLIRKIDSIYQQLLVLDQVNMVTNREVSLMVSYFPPLLRKDWAEFYFKLDSEKQLSPFSPLHDFLSEKLKITKHMADTQHALKPLLQNNRKSSKSSYNAGVKPKPGNCCLHEMGNHPTELCKQFASLSLSKRKEKLVKTGRCFRCFGDHRRASCKEDSPCERCGRRTHHTLMCSPPSETSPRQVNVAESEQNSSTISGNVASHKAHSASGMTLYAIYETPVTSSQKKAVVFCDDGSDASFISEGAIDKLKARKMDKASIEMTTLSGTQTVSTHWYEVTLVTVSGRKVPVLALALPRLSGPVSQLNESVIGQIFTGFDVKMLQRPSAPVDLLLGGDYFGLHPKRELSSDSKNLSVMQGELGVCVQGSHPSLNEDTEKDGHVGFSVRVTSHHVAFPKLTHREFTPVIPKCILSSTTDSSEINLTSNVNVCDEHILRKDSNLSQSLENELMSCSNFAKTPEIDRFIIGEELGTEVSPQCGACRCGKCPIVGHTYSFQEEQELKLINSKLHYAVDQEHWVTGYPWLMDPSLLPDNYVAALATLRNTEKRLEREPEWAIKYGEQIHDMENRGVAVKLTQQEIDSWQGPVFYLSHLAVEQPKSVTTPVRIVFNSSQIYKGVSLNSFLAKGPDSYKTNLLGMLLRFREEAVVLIGDIKKMYNSVFLGELEMHTHRFLWRDLEDRPPDVWCITRVNMGDKPAGAISIEAKDRTADLFRDINPKAADLIKESSYVDDIIDSVNSLQEAKQLTGDAECILEKGGFKVKGWLYGGLGLTESSSEMHQVLGVHWLASEDVICFKAALNFSPKRRNIRTEPDLIQSQVPERIPDTLTRRVVLQQVMGIFDPYGFIAPFVLLAKSYLRETWTLCLGWDDVLPEAMYNKWRTFFMSLFEVETLKFDRCMKHPQAVGNPTLILLSDGSEIAYGCAAYIRWALEDGSFWCCLVMAKCRIAPVNRISIPQMELNGAVLSKRCRKAIESECRFSFDKVIHLVDSETVLCVIHKLSTRFRVYEGVRIGEIQAATGGDVSCWGWISGDQNIADWVTRGRTPLELGPYSNWFKGPPFLSQPFDQWAVRFQPPSSSSSLPGEKKMYVDTKFASLSDPSYSRCSSVKVVIWTYARILSILRAHSFKGGRCSNVVPELLEEAERFLITDAQNTEWNENTVRKQFRTLLPVLQDGCWVVGMRISHHSPLTPENRPLILLPGRHQLTKLFMVEAHKQSGHRGRDATVAKFRTRFWTPHATKLSKSVCADCQLCKLIHVKYMDQIMGQMPPARLMPSPPFSTVMLDLFGPYQVRGEVQKRTSGKGWGVIFTDLCCRAVHIEVVFGYDTKSFLLALSRFASIRGWPSVIYSDPGSQLVAASKELQQIWNSIDQKILKIKGADVGLRWEFGPADSPWYQGAVESLVKSAKKALDICIRHNRLSAIEMLTVFTQVADLLNERPLGILPSPDSPLNVITPNSLLLGRSSSRNPGSYDLHPTLKSRLTLVQSVVDQFWTHWTNSYAPTLIHQSKWLHQSRDLRVDDVVIVADPQTMKAEYRLARVTKIFPSSDGRVRRVKIAYKKYKVGEKVSEYSGAADKEVERSVQRLALLVPVDQG